MEIKIRTAQGEPLSQIAAELGIDRKTARKLRDAEADPNVKIVRKRASRFVEHTAYVQERIGAGVPVAQIARDLARRCGMPVPYTSFWEFAAKLGAESRKPIEEVRFETEPAQQAQCDRADFGEILEDDGQRALSLFVMVLGYSRHTFACLTTSMDEAALQRAHQDAFSDFGGVPHAVLYDNMRTVTSGRDGEGRPIWQRDFADFAGRYGFRPSCARPYRAKTKGKVERTIGFIRRSFLAGRTFVDKADADAQLAAWLRESNQRRHGTHGEFVNERFAREQPLLIAVRAGMARRERVVTRVVDAEGVVTYDTNAYELPRGYRGRELTVRDDGRTVRVCAGNALIYQHDLAPGRGERIKRHDVVAPVSKQTEPIIPRRSLDVYDEVIG